MLKQEIARFDWTTATAVAALILSLITFLLDRLRKKEANVLLLNDGEKQDTVPRPYDRLPESAKRDFPEYEDPHPLYALVRLVFANIGDRPGYARIDRVNVVAPWMQSEIGDGAITVSNYTYALVPPHSVTDRVIMLRNIPLECGVVEIEVKLYLETGGPAGRIRDKLIKTPRQAKIPVRLVPAADTSRVVSSLRP